MEITDRINVVINAVDAVKNAVAAYEDYIKSQILADSIEYAENAGQTVEIDEFTITIQINKV